MTEKEIKQMQAENEALRHEVDQLKNEMIRLVERNLDLSQRLAVGGRRGTAPPCGGGP